MEDNNNNIINQELLKAQQIIERILNGEENVSPDRMIAAYKILLDSLFYEAVRKQYADEENRDKEKVAEERKKMRVYLDVALKNNILAQKEKVLTEYMGYKIVLPANMTPEKPYIWLEREGRYKVELGNTEIGNLVRIDHYLESLPDHLADLKNGLFRFISREEDIEAELKKEMSYVDEIETCRNKLAEIDNALGVSK